MAEELRETIVDIQAEVESHLEELKHLGSYPRMEDERANREGSGGMKFAIWKGIALLLAVLLIAVFAIANYVFNLEFREWSNIAQVLTVVGGAIACVAIGAYFAKRYR